MTKTLLILALAAGLTMTAACTSGEETAAPMAPVATSAPAAENVEQTIGQLEEEWVDAIVNREPAVIERLLADDFVGATDDTTYNKLEAIEDVKFGNHQLEMRDMDVRVFGDTAVVTLDQIEKRMHGEETFDGHYRFTNVWVRRNGQWQAVASHGSRVR